MQHYDQGGMRQEAYSMPPGYPDHVQLIEVGPRDGLQQEKRIIPTEMKVKWIEALADSGLRQIQVVSFVNPKKVPQMADAEQLIRLLPRRTGVIYNALVLNPRGLARALTAGVASVEISVSASDTHSLKNTGMHSDKAAVEALGMIRTAGRHGCHVRAGIQCAFGCVFEGSIAQHLVLEMADRFLQQGVDMLAIADTTGMASPTMVSGLMEKLLPLCGEVPIILHLHDTNGMGLSNLMAAMACGVKHFDTGLGGLGGCPFVPGAKGNVDTIKIARVLQGMNIHTGLDIAGLEKCVELISPIYS